MGTFIFFLTFLRSSCRALGTTSWPIPVQCFGWHVSLASDAALAERMLEIKPLGKRPITYWKDSLALLKYDDKLQGHTHSITHSTLKEPGKNDGSLCSCGWKAKSLQQTSSENVPFGFTEYSAPDWLKLITQQRIASPQGDHIYIPSPMTYTPGPQ